MTQQTPQKRKPKISLRVKIFIAFLIVGVPPVSISLGTALIKGIDIRETNVGTRFENMAVWMSEGIKASFSDEISEAQSLALAPTLLDAVADANKSYEGKDQEEIEKEINALDVEWQTSKKITDRMRSYLSNPVSGYLQNILELQADKYAEIFVTDEQGAIVGATGKTTDFYQADEAWWKDAFNSGNGFNIIEGLAFDESTQLETITIAVPVRDPASRTVMGVLKVIMKSEYLFREIKTLQVGTKGGYVGLISKDQELLATSGPLRTGRVSVDFWEKIVSENKGWTIALNELDEENVIGFAAIEIDGIDADVTLTGGKWYVFFYESADEAYERIYAMATPVFMIGFGLVLGLSLLGFFATSRIVMPIRLLREEAQYIARGDLGRQVDVRTNDEIELLADDINLMSARLKDTHAELEEKIEERTTELSEANKRLEAQRSVLLKVNKQLMKASTLKSEFLADICDGLNNPVVNIMRLAENIVENSGDNLIGTQRDYLGDVLSNAKHLNQLISAVSTLARATSGKIEINRSRFKVEKTLREVQDTVKTLATEKNIKFEFNTDGNVDELDADVNLFKHIVFSLYTNAIKYGRINGKVITESCIADDSVEISVADTGIGIRPEDQERIFREFEKVESAQTPYYEDMGTGLALAKRFVEMHGGKIWVVSEHGKGSKFIFRIPLSQAND
jgi:signal transduction histidine kinase